MLSIRAPFAWLGPGRMVPDVQVDCDGDTVTYVGRVHPVPDDAELIVTSGFLMPAAADRHVHIELGDPVAMLQRGVAAVRDLAWPTDRIFGLAETSEVPGLQRPADPCSRPDAHRSRRVPDGRELGARGHGPRGDDPRRGRGRGDRARRAGRRGDQGVAERRGRADALRRRPSPRSATRRARPTIPVTAHAQGEGQVERALGAGVDELAHAPWTDRLGDDAIAMAAERMRWVSTLVDPRARRRHAGAAHRARQRAAVPRGGRVGRVRHRSRQRPDPVRDPRATSSGSCSRPASTPTRCSTPSPGRRSSPVRRPT